ncbi:MAG: helix-turn-helix domain-containing protein, partial [Clostridia bacterium]|nr:helix-turn-helix domain-containing protein [Clostridia bacterium]
MAKQTVGEFLAILRKAKGLTQQEVAEKLNISNRTLSSWETDRTVPDIIMLPAIADLYGVTVDELLRGERGEKENQAEFSQEALRSARKHHFAKFSLKNIILISFSCLSAVLFITAACMNLFTSSPNWLDAVIASLGGGGIIACTILQIYFYFKAKYSGGIILSEDLTDDKKSYILALKRKFKLYFLISAIPLLLSAIVIGGLFLSRIPI